MLYVVESDMHNRMGYTIDDTIELYYAQLQIKLIFQMCFHIGVCDLYFSDLAYIQSLADDDHFASSSKCRKHERCVYMCMKILVVVLYNMTKIHGNNR